MNKKTEEKKKKILTVANSKNFGIDLIFILAAAVIGSYSTIAVMIPNGMMSGGLSGGQAYSKFCPPKFFYDILYGKCFINHIKMF